MSSAPVGQRLTDITNASYLGTAATSTVTTTDTYYNPNGTVGNTIVTPGSTSSFLGKTFDPNRHQGYVREWLVGYRTQLPGEVVIDASYIDREYRDRPAQMDTNQIYTTTQRWNGLERPCQSGAQQHLLHHEQQVELVRLSGI